MLQISNTNKVKQNSFPNKNAFLDKKESLKCANEIYFGIQRL